MGFIFEQKSFIRSFIKRIWIDYLTATIENTVPINKGNGPDNGTKEVLILAKNGLLLIQNNKTPVKGVSL